MTSVGFTVVGKICPNNRVTRHVGRMTLKSEDARVDEARVRSHAFAVATKTRWAPPDGAALYITAWNSPWSRDVDSHSKVISDGLQGPILRNDRDLVGLHVELAWDEDGERYDVRVEVRPARPAPKSTARRRTAARSRP